MGILATYFCKEFTKLLIICQTVFVSIYLTIDFLQKIDNFIEADALDGAMLTYFFCKIPYIFVQMVPVSTLISVIIMLSLMVKNNEITALKSCGMSIFRISLPLLIASTFLAIVVFLLSELVVPYASTESQHIWGKEVTKRGRDQVYGRNHIWYKGSNSIYWIRHFDSKRMVMVDPTFYFFDDSFQPIKTIQARRAIWLGDRWKALDGVLQVAGDGGRFEFLRFEEMDPGLHEKPETFLRAPRRSEEMSYWQLKRFAERIQIEGYDAKRYLVDMNLKLAFPLINLIMVMLGIPIALGVKRGGIPIAVSLGIGACFIYLLILGLARSLGLSGILPPCLSAWFANVSFFLCGVYLMTHLET